MQVTVKFHAMQKLAVYDQWGRLILGDAEVAKEVVEYVVFEKHIANRYSQWRLHFKLRSPSYHPSPPLPNTTGLNVGRPEWLGKAERYSLNLTFPKPPTPEKEVIHSPEDTRWRDWFPPLPCTTFARVQLNVDFQRL